MPRRGNKLGQYVANDFELSISFLSSLKIIKFLLLVLILSPWVFLLIYKVDLKIWFECLMENMFAINKEKKIMASFKYKISSK